MWLALLSVAVVAGDGLLPGGLLQWKFPTDGWIASSPTLTPDGTSLLIGSDDGHLYNIACDQGHPTPVLNWKKNLSAPTPEPGPPCSGIASTPAISHDGKVVVVGTCNGRVWALNVADGSAIWQTTVGGAVESSATFSPDGGMVYVGSDDNAVRGMAAATGKVVWSFPTGGEVQSTPRVSADGKHVYVGSYDGHVYKVDAAAGTVVWKFLTLGKVSATPTLSADGSAVYFGSWDQFIYGVDTTTGSTLWKYKTYDEVHSSVVLGAGPNATAATTATTISGANASSSGAPSNNDVLYVGGIDNYMYCMNTAPSTPDADRVVWKHLTGDTIYSTPVLAEDGLSLYFGDDDNNLYSLSTAKQTLKRVRWKFATGKGIDATPALSKDGSTVYIGSYDNYVYAVATGI